MLDQLDLVGHFLHQYIKCRTTEKKIDNNRNEDQGRALDFKEETEDVESCPCASAELLREDFQGYLKREGNRDFASSLNSLV